MGGAQRKVGDYKFPYPRSLSADMAPQKIGNYILSRVFDLSGFVARNLAAFHGPRKLADSQPRQKKRTIHVLQNRTILKTRDRTFWNNENNDLLNNAVIHIKNRGEKNPATRAGEWWPEEADATMNGENV